MGNSVLRLSDRETCDVVDMVVDMVVAIVFYERVEK